MKGTTVYISNPTWGNHRNIFGDEGVEWKYYRCIQLPAPSASFASRYSTVMAWLRHYSKQQAALILYLGLDLQ
jgi:aspartate/tyrosine/aromatic aminotransferase